MISLIVTLIIVGVVIYLIQTYVPMPAPIKTVITVVLVLCLCLYLLSAFGVLDVPIPRVHSH